MADTVLNVKDATGATHPLDVSDEGAAGLVPYHLEDATQRAALIAALQALGSHADAQQVLTAMQAPAGIATGQGSASTSSGSTVLVAARAGRRSVLVENTGMTPAYLGGSGVTSGTGLLLPGVAGANLVLSFSGALYAVTASGSAALTYCELY